jgi:hypothetical protein
VPSGEREFGHALVEPAYDLRNGSLMYIMTPAGSAKASHANARAFAPLYIVVYPNAASAVGTMNCAHEGGDNCPDHGPAIADIAQANQSSVYASGVWGHDHLMNGAGGAGFAVGRNVVVVLFTSVAAASEHITTSEQLDAALDSGDAIAIETPLAIAGALVSGAVYDRATPVEPASP